MPGETNLDTLLATLTPQLLPGTFIFCSLPTGSAYNHLSPHAFIQEREGLSLVISETLAREHRIAFDNTYRAISLSVHSSLDAVGLTAAISTRLAAEGISANIVAGYFHDHLFVPSAQAESALAALHALRTEATD